MIYGHLGNTSHTTKPVLLMLKLSLVYNAVFKINEKVWEKFKPNDWGKWLRPK